MQTLYTHCCVSAKLLIPDLSTTSMKVNGWDIVYSIASADWLIWHTVPRDIVILSAVCSQ